MKFVWVIRIEGKKEIRFIDLFGGVGGFRLGLERANNKTGGEIRGEAEWSGGEQGRGKPDGSLRQEGTVSDNHKRFKEESGYLRPPKSEMDRGTDSTKNQLEQREYVDKKRFRCVWYNDNDKWCVRVYNERFGEKYSPKDIRKIGTDEIPDFELLCAGFPCQSFSIAGKRKGFEDTRGTLFYEICRIVRDKRPPLLLLENVKGLLSHDGGTTFQVIIESLDELGYDVEWQVLNSKHFGVPQNRERVFIIGHLGGFPRRKVFPIGGIHREDNGLGGEIDYVRKSKKKDFRVFSKAGISPSLQARNDTHKLEINTAKNSSREMKRIYNPDGLSPTLRVKTGGWQEPKIAQLVGDRDNPSLSFKEIANTVPSNPMSDRQQVVMNTLTEATGNRAGKSKEYLRSVSNIRKSTGQIRRLTPKECERLQGFPDDWTLVNCKKLGYDRPMSDTQRYRMMGNAVTVNVVEAIGRSILESIKKVKKEDG